MIRSTQTGLVHVLTIAGADLGTVSDPVFRERMYTVLHRLGGLPFPVIAAIKATAWASADAKEALQARLDRRPAVFRGR